MNFNTIIIRKTILLLLTLSVVLLLQGQEKGYYSKVHKIAQELDKDSANFDQCIQTADSMIAEFSIEWLPKYYRSYCLVKMAEKEPDGSIADSLLDKAEESANSISSKKENSELIVLNYLIISARIKIEPAKRSMKYGMKASALSKKAKKLDPGNPRVLYIEGLNYYYTPKIFGGNKAKSKQTFEKVLTVSSNIEFSGLEPCWGKREAENCLRVLLFK